MKKPITQNWTGSVLQLCTTGGRVLSEFDFDALGLSRTQTEVLSKAFVPLAGHTSLESQRQYWRSIRKFAQCRRLSGHANEVGYAAGALKDFADRLVEERLSASTCQSHFNAIKNVLAWGQRNCPQLFNDGIDPVIRQFTRSAPTPRNYLDQNQQKQVLRACYLAMDAVEAKLRASSMLLSGEALSDSENDLFKLIKELQSIGNGLLPTQKVLNTAGNNLARRVNEVGGLRHLNRLLWMTPEAMFPFYLAIVIQTSGNPMAIMGLTVSCIKPHPLREDIERFVWEKPRARSEQVLDFPKAKETAAPNIARRYANLVSNLRTRCTDDVADRLFICLQLTPRKVSVPCMQLMHLMLDSFIDEYNLPKFDFRDIRVSGARSHHQAGRSLEAARLRLNHKDVRTTQRYTSLDDRAVEHARAIRTYQGQLVEMSRKYGEREVHLHHKETNEKPAQTVFGFGCRDPFAGIATGSAKGKLCMNFAGCATCPGAIVVLDDINSVARLLASKRALVDARVRALSEGWWPRYKTLYADTLRIIENDLLPRVLPEIVGLAAEISKNISLPHLE